MNRRPIGIVSMSLDKWETSKITHAINERGYEVVLLNGKNTFIDYTSIDQGKRMYHSILGRVERPILEEGLMLLRSYESMGERIINSADAIANSQNKAYGSLHLSKAKIAHPRTILGFTKSVIKDAIKDMEFPVVIKPCVGGRGDGIIKANTYEIAMDFAEIIEYHNRPFYVQEFIHDPRNAIYRDMRIIVVGNKAIGGYYREAQNDMWKTNISTGGKGVKDKVHDDALELAIKATKAIGAEIAGVDIIESDNGLMVLEVNICPLFKAFYTVTGINPADYIADYLIGN